MGKPQTTFIGHVTSGGVTKKVATVRTTVQKFNKFLRKHYKEPHKYHISDPTESLHTNDVVKFIYNPYLSRSKNVAYTVTEIIKAWGRPMEDRPPLLTPAERTAMRAVQIFKRGGKPAELLRQGNAVIDAGGRLRAVASGEEGVKKFGGILDPAVRAAWEEQKANEAEQNTVWWVDPQGQRQILPPKTLDKVAKMRNYALNVEEATEEAEADLAAEGATVESRLEGSRVTGGEVAAAQI